MAFLIVYERPHDTFCNTFLSVQVLWVIIVWEGFVDNNCMGRLTCLFVTLFVVLSVQVLWVIIVWEG